LNIQRSDTINTKTKNKAKTKKLAAESVTLQK